MALDEILLKRCTSDDHPSLRFYCFEPATVSIPIRFNGSELCPIRLAELGWKVCRRISGGKYLLHQLGLTYALVLPRNHTLIADSDLRDSYRKLSNPILMGLQSFDGNVEFLKCRRANSENFDCSMETEVESIGTAGYKFVGSAQKRTKQAILQHGEIQLFSSKFGLGYVLQGAVANASKGLLDGAANFAHEIEESIVWQLHKQANEEYFKLHRFRELVAQGILREFEKVFGKSSRDQLKSPLISQASESRRDFQVIIA